MAAVSPSSLIAWDPSNKGAVAVASYGGGKVLVLGEATNWDNTYLGYANNQLYALNVFNWLSRWLSAAPLTGTVLPGQTITDTISVDSTGLSAGAYYGGLAILSDAYPPGKSPLIVPVTLIVGDHRLNLPLIMK